MAEFHKRQVSRDGFVFPVGHGVIMLVSMSTSTKGPRGESCGIALSCTRCESSPSLLKYKQFTYRYSRLKAISDVSLVAVSSSLMVTS